MSDVRRLHWGCGSTIAHGWVNSDILPAPGVDLPGDIRQGLNAPDASFDYVASHHVLNDLKIYEQVDALTELRRVLKPGGVLRMSLPDMDVMIAAYQRGDNEFFLVQDWETIAGNFITHLLWYNINHTPFTYAFAEELLRKAGFAEVRRVAYQQTASRFPAITELDGREAESFYVEATK